MVDDSKLAVKKVEQEWGAAAWDHQMDLILKIDPQLWQEQCEGKPAIMEIVGEFIRRARFTIIGTRHDFRSWVTGELPMDKDETTSWKKFDQLAQDMKQVARNIIEKFVNTMPEEKLAWMNEHQQQQRNDAMLEHAVQLSLQQPVGSTPSVAVETEYDDDKDLKEAIRLSLLDIKK